MRDADACVLQGRAVTVEGFIWGMLFTFVGYVIALVHLDAIRRDRSFEREIRRSLHSLSLSGIC